MKLQGEIWNRVVGEFARVGRCLFDAGLNNTHSGNMSIRVDDEVIISRHGAMLGDLGAEDLVVRGMDCTGEDAAPASTEFGLHRSIYFSTPALAVVHTHPRSATALSLSHDEIIPVDLEGQYYFKRVPVAPVEEDSGPERLMQAVSLLLRDGPIAVVRGHGAFAAGDDLESCLKVSHSLEWSCDIILRCRVPGPSGVMPVNGKRQGAR